MKLKKSSFKVRISEVSAAFVFKVTLLSILVSIEIHIFFHMARVKSKFGNTIRYHNAPFIAL